MNRKNSGLNETLAVLMTEGRRRILLLTIVFTVVALLALVIGLYRPKRYESSSLLIVESANIIKPLMDGRAVTMPIADQVAVTVQGIASKRILREILASGGFPEIPRDPKEEERVLAKLRAAIHIKTVRDQMVRISYEDTDPQRTYRVATLVTEIFIRESAESKQRESREAFEFISRQAKDYGEQLAKAHQELLAYYSGGQAPGDAATPGGLVPGVVKEGPGRSGGRMSAEELAALRAEEAALVEQLSKTKGGPPATPGERKQAVDRHRAQVTQLKAELERLSITYTDNHPDVARVRRELAQAEAELDKAVQAQRVVDQETEASDDLENQVVRGARARLEVVRRRLAAANAGSGGRSIPLPGVDGRRDGPGADPELRGVGKDTVGAELLRRYTATRDIYQDMLKRRENARVSMDLDAEQRGLSMRIQDPAEMPVTASGLRLLYVILIGLIISVAVPCGLLVLLVQLDQRIRSQTQIAGLTRVPLLVSIPFEPPHQDRSRERVRTMAIVVMVTAVFAVYAASLAVRMIAR